MKELFEKVYINSETDLPKKAGIYHAKECDMVASYMVRFANTEHAKKQWMKSIDWYLKPIEQESK